MPAPWSIAPARMGYSFRVAVKTLIRRLHLWLGLGTGAIVFIVGLTGALYAFEAELRLLIHADRAYVEVPEPATRVPLQRLYERAEAAIGGEAPAVQMRLHADPARSVVVVYERYVPEVFGYWRNNAYRKHVYLDPYTGEVLEVANLKWEVLELIQWTHTSLLLGYDYGHHITSWSVVLFFAMMLSGLVLWWPRNRQVAAQRLWFRWGERTGWKRKNYDLHSILGAYVVSIASIIAFTGLIWSFDVINRGAQWLVNGGRHIPGRSVQSTPSETHVPDPLDRIYADLRTTHPEADHFVLHLRTAHTPDGVYYGTAFLTPAVWKNSAYAYDKYTVGRLKAERHEDKTNGARLYDLVYDLHTGAVLGLPGKVLACGASLVVASFPVSGFLLWWGRRKKSSPA